MDGERTRGRCVSLPRLSLMTWSAVAGYLGGQGAIAISHVMVRHGPDLLDVFALAIMILGAWLVFLANRRRRRNGDALLE